jgi:hypothetical protein
MSTTSPALTTAQSTNGLTEPARPNIAQHVGHDRPTAPLLRRLPLRDAQPPFDDELGSEFGDEPRGTAASGSTRRVLTADVAGGRSQQGALKLAFTLASGVPAVPDVPPLGRLLGDSPAPALRLVPPIAARTRRRTADDVDDEFGPRQTPRALLPDPRPWAGRLVQGVVEAMAGVRPVSQLVRWTTTEVYGELQNRAIRALHERRGPTPRRLAEVVRSVHVSEPVDGVAEVCAIVQQGPRCRAIALRLEGADGRWRCTALQMG